MGVVTWFHQPIRFVAIWALYYSNPAYFLIQETIVYEERAVIAPWEAIASQQEQLDVLMKNVEEIEKTIKNKGVVY